MTTSTRELEQVLALARKLSAAEKALLLEEVASELKADLTNPRTPKKNVYGLLAGLDISGEDIAEARRELWGNFPREDI